MREIKVDDYVMDKITGAKGFVTRIFKHINPRRFGDIVHEDEELVEFAIVENVSTDGTPWAMNYEASRLVILEEAR